MEPQKPPPDVIDRPYFAAWLLWSAQHEAELARQIEERREPDQRYPFIEHRAYVVSSILASATFLEAMVNELYQDVDENYSHFGVIDRLPKELKARMRSLWERTKGGRRGSTLEKYENLVELDHDDDLYKNASLIIEVRHAIVHYKPSDGFTAEQALRFEEELKAKFPPNPLHGTTIRAWWPEHALGAGFATWAHRSVRALADHVSSVLDIEPDYAMHKEGTWFDLAPGKSELCSRPEDAGSEKRGT